MAMKACRQCRALFEGSKCLECGSTEHLDSFKGKIIVLNPEQSEISKKLSLPKKGLFAVRLR
ncbi:MAG: transcription elongation factor subunit Spt4 [Nanoarchaeota archaeon]